MKLALFAGPSGGHVFPALAFRDAFRKKHPEAEFAIVVPSRVPVFLRRALETSRDPVFYVPDFPLPPVLSLKAIPLTSLNGLFCAKASTNSLKVSSPSPTQTASAYLLCKVFSGIVEG